MKLLLSPRGLMRRSNVVCFFVFLAWTITAASDAEKFIAGPKNPVTQASLEQADKMAAPIVEILGAQASRLEEQRSQEALREQQETVQRAEFPEARVPGSPPPPSPPSQVAVGGPPILPARVRKIADALVRLCTAGASTQPVIARPGKTSFTLQSLDSKGKLISKFKIKKSDAEKLIAGMKNAVTQVATERTEKMADCLNPIIERLGALASRQPLQEQRPQEALRQQDEGLNQQEALRQQQEELKRQEALREQQEELKRQEALREQQEELKRQEASRQQQEELRRQEALRQQEELKRQEALRERQEELKRQEALRERQEELKRQEALRQQQQEFKRQEALRQQQEELKRQEALREQQEELKRQEALRQQQEELKRQEALRQQQQEELKRQEALREQQEELKRQEVLRQQQQEELKRQEALREQQEELKRQEALREHQEELRRQEALRQQQEELKRQEALLRQQETPQRAEFPRRHVPSSPSPAPPPSQVAVGALPILPTLVPVRSYLRAMDIPPPQTGAYGVVAFRSKPSSTNRDRLLNACIAYTAHLPRTETLPPSLPITDQMLTIWPLEDPSAPAAIADDCQFVVDHYDLHGGTSAIQDAQKHGGELDGQGPFLIGWFPSNSRGVPDKVVLVVDLSSFESQDSFDSAFLFWQTKIVENPMLWVSGFSAERLRLAIRDFVDHYGQDVMIATKILGTKN